VHHPGPELTCAIEQAAHVADQVRAVGSERGQHRICTENTVLALYADDGRRSGAPLIPGHSHTLDFPLRQMIVN
jgi:hypothetical protein